MKKLLLLLIALVAGLAGQTAMATTKTYIFSGQQTDQTQFTGYFYAEGAPSTHYNCSPNPWTYGSTGALSFTLADGITLTLSSSTNKLQYLADNGLFAKDEATLAVSGGSTYYIYRIRLLDGNGNVIQLDANGIPVNSGGVTLCDYLNTTKSFSQTYTNSIGFKKIQISYITDFDNIAGDAYQGSGTENDPYIISSTSDLDLLAKLVNAGNKFSGKFFQQSADITYTHTTNWNDPNSTENNYTAIGYEGHAFNGTFDGGGHTISGIRIYRNTTSDNYQGLFGLVYGTIKRVNLADTRITGRVETGGIAGYLSGGTVEDCTAGSDVCIHEIYSSGNHGGIVGHNTRGTVRRCISSASLTVKSGVSTSGYGGIVGYTYGGTITDCIALGATIPNVNARGAIVGFLYNDCTLTRNYYYNCKVASNSVTPSGVGQGTSSSTETSDVDGVQALYAITLGPNITLNRSAEAILPGTNNKTYENGADINGQPYAYAGATVTLGYTNLPEGYKASYAINGTPIEGDTFEMPAGNVTVTATVQQLYAITLPSETPHGTVTSDKETATMGETVTLTAVPETGYALGTLTVMNGDSPVATTAGQNGTYTFEMPAAPVTVAAEFGLPIDSINFPDANFRNWLLSQSYGSDAVLTDEEIAGITSIHITYKSIAALTGIEYFTALTSLNCQGNRLTVLDVSENTALTRLDCGNNQLATLDMSENTALMQFYCDQNQLSSLDVSHNTALKVLECYSNQLTALDVSHNTALVELSCYDNQINGENMEALVASLPTVDVTNNGGQNGQFYVIGLNFAIEQNFITTTQVATARSKNWDVLDGGGNGYDGSAEGLPIDSINFPDANFRNYLLSQSYGSDRVLTDDEIAGITSISVAYKNIADLTGIEYFTALKSLSCGGNQLTALDVSHNTALRTLDCSSNPLGALDVSHNTALTRLQCGSNQLTALDVNHNTALTRLDCYDNQLSSLDVSQNAALDALLCNNNQLTTLDVSNNTALTILQCYNNQINGENMAALVASLPTAANGNGQFRVIDLDSDTEQNVITTTQVATARGKNWTVLGLTNNGWQDYDGSEPAIPGDLNGDDAVDIADVNICINIILERNNDPAVKILADLSGDGTVDITDVNAIINIILAN